MSALALHNGNILTLNPAQPRAESIAVRDGRIVAVGDWNVVAPYARNLPLHDLGGRTALPGFIDSHVHFTWTGLQHEALSFRRVGGIDEVQAILSQAARDSEPERLLFGMGIDEYGFPGRALPRREQLDAVLPDRPVAIMGVTGHYMVLNTKGLASLNLPSATPGLDAASGKLVGMANVLAGRPLRARYAREVGYQQLHQTAAAQALSVGITTVHALEGEDQPDDPAVLALLEHAADLPIRLVVYYQTTQVEAVTKLGLPRIGGCILVDGDFGPHTAALLEPYIDDPQNSGVRYFDQQTLDGFVERAHAAGLQIGLHCVGDGAVDQALRAYEWALLRWPASDHRLRIEHYELYNDDLLERTVRLSIHAAIQPPFDHFFGGHQHLIPFLGVDRALCADPVRSLVDAGIPVGGGSDSTVTPLGPLLGIHSAVNHSNPAERVSLQKALELYTIDNARLAFEEKEKGSLEVGKLGDLVVLAEDPYECEPSRLQDIQVEMTIVSGEIRYERALAARFKGPLV